MVVWVVVAGQGSRRLITRCVVVGSFFVEETRQRIREGRIARVRERGKEGKEGQW